MAIVTENTRLLPRSTVGGFKTGRRRIFFIVAVLMIIGLQYLYGIAKQDKLQSKRNVIFFVTDGMGPASLSMTRSFMQEIRNLTDDRTMELEKYHIGSSRTRSSSSLITDSAAGATAFSCALRSYNGAVGVGPDQRPCGTLLEAAKLAGYMTGLVVTTRVTDATPAAFSSHADFRWYEDLIAQQQLGEYPLGRMVDLIIGGGRTHFYPPGQTKYGKRGSRKDGRDLVETAIEGGWHYVQDRVHFKGLQNGNLSLPFLALLADYDIPYAIDRNEAEYPSLAEQALTAVNALADATRNSDQGFFLLIEGSRIDHAQHSNDPAAAVHEVLAFDEAFSAVRDYVMKLDVETVVLSTSDHETGGLSVARQIYEHYPEYIWYPEVLAKVQHSAEHLARAIISFTVENHNVGALREFVGNVFKNGLGITDYTDEDIDDVLKLDLEGDIIEKLAGMVSVRAEIGWATHGHSATDVNIYGYSNSQTAWQLIKDELGGNHKNTEIGAFLEDYLQVNLAKVTELLKDTKHSE